MDFVDDFNNLTSLIDNKMRSVPESKIASQLLGDSSVIRIQEGLRRTVLSVIPGLSFAINQLGAVGITIGEAGLLTVDEARLLEVLSGADEEIRLDDVRRLFVISGEATDSDIVFIISSDRTEETTAPILIDIIQAAEQATITAEHALD